MEKKNGMGTGVTAVLFGLMRPKDKSTGNQEMMAHFGFA
jgi:hypothetical protein